MEPSLDGRRRLRALSRLAEQRRVVLLGDKSVADYVPVEVALAPRVAASIVVGRGNVGLLGYAAGPHVHVVDRLGLGDALAARMRILQRGRPGHERWLSDAWVVARFADPTAPLPSVGPAPGDVAAARAALGCGPLAELFRAIEAPLSPRRVVRNVAVAWRLHRLDVPADPTLAASELCGEDLGRV